MGIEAEQQLFDACLAAADAAASERLLAEFPDQVVARRVRRLLAQHESGVELAAPVPSPSLPLPQQVGPYRILERIGEGGIGEVYLAEQQTPVRRRIALKILKPGVGTREVIARFELERQTLALMSHPNIARIHDAGATTDGRPYIAMEYVPGMPITRFCDEQGLDIDARLALFEQVCAGVQHAHLRGVIHRDLKPSNVLVTQIDGVANPKIIDFGIAKAATMSGADAYTRVGHLLGTPEYMSPEQVQLSPLDIDARTDVYSLGVLLYELLTGTRPYQVRADVPDPGVIAGDIRDGEVDKPSQRVLRGPVASRAARLRGDLDWIVLKALEKDRQRRYSSAADLAEDLQRSRSDQPVSAGPPGTAYVLGKFVRRHRLGVAMVSMAFLAAVAFALSMSVMARRAEVERDRARNEAEVARSVTEFTAGIFESADPGRSGGAGISARQLLDAGVRRMQNQVPLEREDIQAALLEAAANAYRGLGAYEEAGPLMQRAVALRAAHADQDPAAYGVALLNQSLLSERTGEYEAAEAQARDAVERLSRASPPEVRRLREARLELAKVLRLRSKLDEAAQLAGEVVREYDVSGSGNAGGLALSLTLLGRIETDRGNLADAMRHLERGLALHRQAFGTADLRTLEAKGHLAWAMVTMDASDRAEPVLREIVEELSAVYGPDHPEVGVAMSNLGNAISDMDDRLADAEVAYLGSIRILRAASGTSAPELATSLNNLCSLYLRWKRWQDARAACAESRQLRLQALGPEHPDTAAAELGEALALNRLGDLDGAEQRLRNVIAVFTARLDGGHWRIGNAETYLGMVLTAQRRFEEARSVLQHALQGLSASLGEEHWRTVAARDALADLERVAR